MSPIRPENRGRYPDDWPEIRAAVLARAGHRCECRGECGHDHAAEVDPEWVATQASLRALGQIEPATEHDPPRCSEIHQTPAEYARGMVVLTVAHLDHQPEHNDPSNLRAMCQRCHLAHDREHHTQTRAETRRRATEAAGQLAITETS